MTSEENKLMEIPEDMKAIMFQTWLPAIVTTLLAEIGQLPKEQNEYLLTRMCMTCEELAIEGALGCQPGMSWEDYCTFIQTAPPPIGPWTIKQEGNQYDLYYDCSKGPDGNPRCHCPLVQLGMIEKQNPCCCHGGGRLSGKMIASATGKEIAHAETITSAAMHNSMVCHYRVRTK